MRAAKLARLILAIGAVLLIGGNVRAQQAQLLSDMSGPGEWKLYQWNKAPGELSIAQEFPPAVQPEAGKARESLCMKVHFPGGEGFRFFHVEPVKPIEIPADVVEIRLWMKGSGTPHYIELHFTDAQGADVKMGPSPNRLSFTTWQQVRARIPAEWARPLKFRFLTFHDWGITEPADITVYAARLEAAAQATPAARPADKAGLGRVLAHLDFASQWTVSPWNKAPGRITDSDEFPPAVATEAGAPRRSVCATVSWSADRGFQHFSIEPARKAEPIAFAVLRASLWVKGSGTGHSIELHFEDANGQGVKVGLGNLKFTEWRKLTAKIPPAWAQPLKFKAVTLHSWGIAETVETTIYLAQLEIEIAPEEKLLTEGDQAQLIVIAPGENGLVTGDGQATVYLEALRWAAGSQDVGVRYEVVGWDGKPLANGQEDLRLDGQCVRAVNLDLPRFGPYTVRAELAEVNGGKVLSTAQTRLVRPAPVPRLSMAERGASPVGVNVHLGAFWGSLAACGVHWARDYSWSWLGRGETAPVGQGLDFSRVWRTADEAGVTILPCLQKAFRNPENTAFIEDGAAIAAGFERLSRAFPDVAYWELDNEAEYNWRPKGFDPANYQNLIRNAAAGLRRAGNAEVVLNGTAGIRYEDTVELLTSPAQDDFAVVNYHYYTDGVAPELAKRNINVEGGDEASEITFLDELRRINRLAHAAGKQAWLTEIGWDVTYGFPVGERLQAIYLPRMYLLARLCGTDKVFWYFDRDVQGSTTRFASCGLFDLENALRPSAAAMAALSRETGLAKIGGSVDLGEDRWCVLLEKPGGGWVAAAWSVEREHPVPPELAGAEAYDIFGNPTKPQALSPEITYFHLAALPASWEAQRHCEWLSPSILTVVPGDSATAQVRAPGARMSWSNLPAGVTGSPWSEAGGVLTSRLTCSPEVEVGSYQIAAVADQPTWSRQWAVRLLIRPAVEVSSEPYVAGVRTPITVKLAGSTAQQISLEPALNVGQVEPLTIAGVPGARATVSFSAAPTARGPVPLTVRVQNGVRQQVWLRPLAIDVPRVGKITLDGDLADWPAEGKLSSEHFVITKLGFRPEVWLGWSAEGLWLGGRIPVRDLQPANPREFWNWTNVELFVDPSAGDTRGWGKAAHQLWFSPVREGEGWRLYVGEWKRGDSIPATIYDDPRCKTAIQIAADAVTLEALIPAIALGGQGPQAGQSWRAGISLRSASGADTRDAGWPRTKTQGLLDGSHMWGILRFM